MIKAALYLLGAMVLTLAAYGAHALVQSFRTKKEVVPKIEQAVKESLAEVLQVFKQYRKPIADLKLVPDKPEMPSA